MRLTCREPAELACGWVARLQGDLRVLRVVDDAGAELAEHVEVLALIVVRADRDPAPSPARLMVSLNVGVPVEKVAVTALSSFIVNVHVLVAHAAADPPPPENRPGAESKGEFADSLTTVPGGTVSGSTVLNSTIMAPGIRCSTNPSGPSSAAITE